MPETPQFNEDPKIETLSDEEKSRKRVEVAKKTLRDGKEKYAKMGEPYYQHYAYMDIHGALMAAMDFNEDDLTTEEWVLLAEEFNSLPKSEVRRPKYHYENQPLEKLIELRSPIEQAEVNPEIGAGTKSEYLETYIHATVEHGNYPADLEKIKAVFAGHVVVDLGAGEESNGYSLANDADAKSYIGVEPFHAVNLKSVLEYDSGWNPPEKAIPFSVVQTDMLTLLTALEDGSVSVLLSGIDYYIISDSEYRNKVINELKRVLADDGGVFSCHSDLLHSPKTDEEGIIKLSNETFIYNKKTIF